VGKQLAGEAEAEGLLAADAYRRQRVGLVCQVEPVPGVVIGQGGAFFVAQEVQVARHGAAKKGNSTFNVHIPLTNNANIQPNKSIQATPEGAPD